MFIILYAEPATRKCDPFLIVINLLAQAPGFDLLRTVSRIITITPLHPPLERLL